MDKIQIHLTDREDLANVQRLWADPAVMRYVGFPDGLHETMENLRDRWLPWVQNPPKRQHYSVYSGDVYCGESFYDVDETGLACMDIKLLPEARGKGIASAALSYALTQAFSTGGAERAYVDPNPENQKALALYARLGFQRVQRPSHLENPGCPYVYLEMTRQNWAALHENHEKMAENP
ncbi:MAG: GNAT family N-acetyltransferase [Faecousia sp.]